MYHNYIRNATSDFIFENVKKNVKVDRTMLLLHFLKYYSICAIILYLVMVWGLSGYRQKKGENLWNADIKHIEELHEDAVRAKFDKILNINNHLLHKCLSYFLIVWGRAHQVVELTIYGTALSPMPIIFITVASSSINSFLRLISIV